MSEFGIEVLQTFSISTLSNLKNRNRKGQHDKRPYGLETSVGKTHKGSMD